jgi:hypothetical protein
MIEKRKKDLPAETSRGATTQHVLLEIWIEEGYAELR